MPKTFWSDGESKELSYTATWGSEDEIEEQIREEMIDKWWYDKNRHWIELQIMCEDMGL